MSYLPRVPVRFIEDNKELLEMQKSTSYAGLSHDDTNHKISVDALPVHMEAQYRTPLDRVNGNCMFRRLPDGSLDYDYAKHHVVDAVHKVRDQLQLTSLEEVALSCIFPATFSFVDSGVVASVRSVNLRLSAEEASKLAMIVADHLAKEMQFMNSCHAR